LVFVTKYRKGVLDNAMLQRCEEIMREVCAGFETELREFNGEADHVHLLVHYPPKTALSKLINSLKGVSSRYLRAQYTGRINRIGLGSVFWSRSYFAGSCGGAPLSIIRQYIEGQQRPV
jgi:putative transposase